MMNQLIMYGPILLQSLEANDILNLAAAKDFTVTGVILVVLIFVWRKWNSAEEKYTLLNEKYIDLLITNTRVMENATKIIDENTKMYARLEKYLDK